MPSAPPVLIEGAPSSVPEHAADRTAPQTRQSLAPLATIRHGEGDAWHDNLKLERTDIRIA